MLQEDVDILKKALPLNLAAPFLQQKLYCLNYDCVFGQRTLSPEETALRKERENFVKRKVIGLPLSNSVMEGKLWEVVENFHDGFPVYKMSIRLMGKVANHLGEQEHVDLGLYGVRLMTVYLLGENSYVIMVRGTSSSTSWKETVRPGRGYILAPESVRDCSHMVGPTTSGRVVATMGYMLEGEERFLRPFTQQKVCWGRMLHWTKYYKNIVTEAAKDRGASPMLRGDFWDNDVLPV